MTSGPLTFGSLFSGIGGFDLGLESAGMRPLWQCEADAYCRAVLARHWPDVPCYEDVRDIDARAPRVDVLPGGFPCQPVSNAGRGLAQADERWLWPEFARVIRDLRPRYVIVENVPGLLGRGFGDVLGDLAALGYDAEWDCIPAAALGAPHIRDRVWLLAYPQRQGQLQQGGAEPEERGWAGNSRPQVADSNGSGLEGHGRPLQRAGEQPLASSGVLAHAPSERRGPARPAGPGASDGRRAFGEPPRSGGWLPEPDVGRVAHGVPARMERLRALGNALVPQIAEWIGRRIVSYEEVRQRVLRGNPEESVAFEQEKS